MKLTSNLELHTKKEEILYKLSLLEISVDTEYAHVEADALLCDFLEYLGHKDVVEMYQVIGKWYA